MTSELKHCPFCDVKKTWLRRKMGMYYVICESCGSRTGYWFSEKQAIAAWNQRAERTCKNEYEHANSTWWFECSLCGAITSTEWKYIGSDMPRYCPHCGAKVVQND